MQLVGGIDSNRWSVARNPDMLLEGQCVGLARQHRPLDSATEDEGPMDEEDAELAAASFSFAFVPVWGLQFMEVSYTHHYLVIDIPAKERGDYQLI